MQTQSAEHIDARFRSIDESAKILAVSAWTVKDLLRKGILRARKSGRRTLVECESISTYAASLPIATFTPPVKRRA